MLARTTAHAVKLYLRPLLLSNVDVVIPVNTAREKQAAENERYEQEYDHTDQPHRVGRAGAVLPERDRGQDESYNSYQTIHHSLHKNHLRLSKEPFDYAAG